MERYIILCETKEHPLTLSFQTNKTIKSYKNRPGVNVDKFLETTTKNTIRNENNF